MVTEGLASHGAAGKSWAVSDVTRLVDYETIDRVESSHLPIRPQERKMRRFKSQAQAQWFVSARSATYNCLNFKRHRISRNTMRKLGSGATAERLAASAAAA